MERQNDPIFDLAALEEGQEPLDRPAFLDEEDLDLSQDVAVEEGLPLSGAERDASGDGSQGERKSETRELSDAETSPPPSDVSGTQNAAASESTPGALTDSGAQRRSPTFPSPATSAPEISAQAAPVIPPADPLELRGLSTTEAASRAARGRVNVDTTRERMDREIIRENVLTFFNFVLGSLIVILLVLAVVDGDAGHAQDGLFVGLIVMMNVAVGTYQELRATHTLRRLVASTAPHATVIRDGRERAILSREVVEGDLVQLKPGDQVVADGPVIAGNAEIDESLLTGESSSIRKEAGSEILSGSFCVAGSCSYTAQRVGTDAYAVRLTADARQLIRRETPLQIRFRRILRMLLMATAILGSLLLISAAVEDDDFAEAIKATTATISSIVPEGLLLGMTVAFAVGAVRLSKRGAIVQDINAVEAMNYVDVVCLDKTGTITANKLTLHDLAWSDALAPAEGEALRPWIGAFAAEVSDESQTADALAEGLASLSNGAQPDGNVPFNSARRWSAMQLRLGDELHSFVMGAPETLLPFCPPEDAPLHGIENRYQEATAKGLRGVMLAEADALPDPDQALPPLRALALITVADVLRSEVASAFAMMERLGIEPKIISGDNPETVAALVQQLGITLHGGLISGAELAALSEAEFRDVVERTSVFGRVAPEQKAAIVGALREQGHYIAMVGDGANDVRALRAADVAVAMESGTQTARAVSGIVLRDDSFQAFVYGAAAAQSILGNSAQLSKLFITKSFYAFLIIIASNMLGLDFPFLPRHGSLTALFTLGIPSIFIAATTPPQGSGRDFTNTVLRFAIPASLALAAATISVHLLTEGILARSIEEARTLVSLTIGIVGLYFMVQVVGYEGVSWGWSWRAVRRQIMVTSFGAALVGLFILTLYTPFLRDFFDFGAIGVTEWSIVIPAVVAAMAGQYIFSRYWRAIIGWITKQAEERELARGRAT